MKPEDFAYQARRDEPLSVRQFRADHFSAPRGERICNDINYRRHQAWCESEIALQEYEQLHPNSEE